MVKCKYEGTGIWNGRCTGTKEVDPCPGYDKCKQYKPNYTTNADIIRSMSDEELAAWIASMTTVCECCAEINECESPKCFNKCLHGVEDWLKQPPKGESNNE